MALTSGQRTLLQDYVQPAIDEYFTNNREPNIEGFLATVAGSHPAVAPALGHVLNQVWHASYFAYGDALLKSAKEDTKRKGEQVLKTVTKARAKAQKSLDGEWSKFDTPDGWDKYHRQLTKRQFLGPDLGGDEQPFWWHEQNRLVNLFLDGKIDHDNLIAQYAYIIESTNEAPNSLYPPSGYIPYGDPNYSSDPFR